MKITSWDLKKIGIIDDVVPEPNGGAHANPLQAAEKLKMAIVKSLDDLSHLSSQQRRKQRYQKFRSMGVFLET